MTVASGGDGISAGADVYLEGGETSLWCAGRDGAALDAGAVEAGLIRSDAAMAVGAGLSILEPEASLLVDVGAGKISATLFTRGLVAAYAYLPYGVARIDERLARMLRTERGFLIGPKR